MKLISKEKVFAIIKKEMGEVDSWRILREINKIPTIESGPTGTWHQSFWKMPTAREVRLFHFYECDFCENEVMVERIDGYNYCPHCGADMRGEE